MNIEDNGIQITPEAVNAAYMLYKDENNERLDLRISVEGGGCSGFQYNFNFDNTINQDDLIINLKNQFSLIIDTLSLQYLQGSIIDFKENMEGAQFVIENPNTTTTCGCGNSFSV